MRRWSTILLGVLAACTVTAEPEVAEPPPEPEPPPLPALDPPRAWRASTETIRSGDTLAGALVRMGVDGGTAQAMVAAFAEAFNVRHIRPEIGRAHV